MYVIGMKFRYDSEAVSCEATKHIFKGFEFVRFSVGKRRPTVGENEHRSEATSLYLSRPNL